jgi:hypothetical protein
MRAARIDAKVIGQGGAVWGGGRCGHAPILSRLRAGLCGKQFEAQSRSC